MPMVSVRILERNSEAFHREEGSHHIWTSGQTSRNGFFPHWQAETEIFHCWESQEIVQRWQDLEERGRHKASAAEHEQNTWDGRRERREGRARDHGWYILWEAGDTWGSFVLCLPWHFETDNRWGLQWLHAGSITHHWQRVEGSKDQVGQEEQKEEEGGEEGWSERGKREGVVTFVQRHWWHYDYYDWNQIITSLVQGGE